MKCDSTECLMGSDEVLYAIKQGARGDQIGCLVRARKVHDAIAQSARPYLITSSTLFLHLEHPV